MAIYATYTVEVDWNNDGDWSDANETVTSRVIESVSITLGRDQARAFSPVAPGTMSFSLNNRSRDYYPDNSGSPIGSNLKPGRAVRCQATYSATTYGLYRGFTEDFTISPARNERKVSFTCSDALARLRNTTISTGLSEGIRTGDAIDLVLAAAGWTGGIDTDIGATVIRYWWAEQTDALSAIQQLVASEGSPALVYIDPANGNFCFRDRHHRLTRTASTTSQTTLRDTGAEPKFSHLTDYQAGWSDVINDITLQVDERQAQRILSQVWTMDERISVGASATLTIEVQASDPFRGAVTPVAGTDYNVLTGSVSSVSLSRTSGQSTVISITAGASGATIDALVLRAYSIPVVRSVKIRASDATSITDYGSRGLPDDLQPVWAGRYDAQALADLYVLQRKQRLPIMQVTVAGAADATRLTQCLARTLSDRITIVDAVTGINADFFIERVQHEIDASQGGRIHATTFGLERVPAAPATAGFILGTSVLNTGVLGY
jgi:hypothetical protein